ncbi:MAG TPA: AraC family transcriptional regulator [Pyrinomonadaceae bacterium]|nr:AraC family transcriptional regulator [Pyrinomonadaceae bacterium]
MQTSQNWQLKFWRLPHLDDVELLHAAHVTHDYPAHMHEEYSIALVLEGTEETICNGKSHKARRGDLLFVNAEQVHASRSADSEYRAFKIWPDALARITGKSNTTHFPHLVVNDSTLFRALLSLHRDLEQNGSALEQESRFVSTMAFLLERQGQFGPDTRSKNEDCTVRVVRDYLRDHYAENVSLSQLTSLTNLSPFYLLRVFRNRAGFPPHEYQTQVRIAHARRLIRTGTPLSQAAIETGFFDQSHLSRNFKRIVGVTPRQYFRS